MNYSCSLDVYDKWYNTPYTEDLSNSLLLALISAERKDKYIWHSIMDFDNTRERFFAGALPISNGQVMELSGRLCRRSLTELRLDLAGQHAPISSIDIHDVMCNTHCDLNDKLRFVALNVSRCDCLQLSFGPALLPKKLKGGFCYQNSGDFLCTELGQCGSWECAEHDFGCKRIEYNQIEVPLRGFGDQCSHASRFSGTYIAQIILCLTTLISILW